MPATSPFAADLLSASGRSAEKLNLPTLQDKMKRDPESYESELTAIQGLFDSSLELFKQQAALSFSSISGISPDSTIAKDLSDRTMFLAHMAPFYPKRLSNFPIQLAEFLNSSAKSLPSGLRLEVTKALILLMNRKMADIRDALALFMELQTLGDKVLRKLAFDHVVHTIRRMNKKSKNQTMNRALQKIMFETLKQDDEVKAKRALITLRELHRRKVWFDDETSNAICRACLHPSPRVMIAALSFLLDYEKIEDDTDSDESSDEDELAKMPTVISKEAIYKAHNKGTVSSKKKKKAKLERAMRSMKKQQRLSSEKNNTNYYSPLSYLIDAQGFAEKLFSRLQNSNERFEVKLMALKVVARTIGLHRLILLNFYTYLQNYAKPHQRDVTTVLASAVQACHDMVPPDTVEPLFRQIVNQFVHDKSRPESIAVGLNVVREICLRIPSLMTEELLQDLVLYKKTHEKAVSTAARSLVSLFREICPSMLAKKDRGRPNDLKAKPKAYGETSVAENVPGLELLENDDGEDSSDNDSDDDMNIDDEKLGTSDNEDNEALSFNSGSEDDDEFNDDDTEHAGEDDTSSFGGDIGEATEDDDEDEDGSDVSEDEDDDSDEEDENVLEDGSENSKSKTKKRKFSDFDKQLISGDSSLRALKKLGASLSQVPTDSNEDGILSNEDFKRIKELKAKKDAKSAMFKHGLLGKGADAKSSAFKVLNADQLSSKRVDPAKLEAHVRQKLNKEERLALVRAGREDRGKYTARAAVKQKKTGGMSNKQKEHKKAMPIAAKRAKIARSRNQKGKKKSGKQFRGKKAWK